MAANVTLSLRFSWRGGFEGHRIIAMRTLRFASSILVVFIILFLGCQHAAIAYRLRRDGLDPILLPPTAVDQPSESVSIAIKHRQKLAALLELEATHSLVAEKQIKGKSSEDRN